MWVRKRLDIGWSDLSFGISRSCVPQDRGAIRGRIEQGWCGSGDALACLSVRSGFDLLLESLQLPPGSEVLLSALTIGDMVRLVQQHGLVPVPVDIDVPRTAPDLELLRSAITPRSRAIVVAHLFGGKAEMGPILEAARQHGLLVIEDCAQAFAGDAYRGHPEADVSMFSFGPIKTATALGGGVLRIADDTLREKMRRAQAAWPVQSRRAYLGRLLKYCVLKAFCGPSAFGLLVRVCRVLRRDHDRLINGAVRGFAGPGFLKRIRRQPSAPLLALIERRLERFDPGRLATRTAKGELLVQLLAGRIECPGARMVGHTHWVFPVLADDPDRLIAALAKAGFDATRNQSLVVVTPADDRPWLDPGTARAMLARTVFVPLYAAMPTKAIRRMAEVILQTSAARPPGEPCVPVEQSPDVQAMLPS